MSELRRSPHPEERLRDAERTKQALLDAARAEFGSKGLAGARVSEIAARAGVNKQLINYYFGGKEGLYQAILASWYAQERELTDPTIGLADLTLRCLEIGHRQGDLQRLFVRESLDRDVSEVAFEPDCEDLRSLRARRAAGEFAVEFDPGFVLMFLQAVVLSGTVLPGEVKRLTGLDPASPEYLERARQQIRLLVERLA